MEINLSLPQQPSHFLITNNALVVTIPIIASLLAES